MLSDGSPFIASLVKVKKGCVGWSADVSVISGIEETGHGIDIGTGML